MIAQYLKRVAATHTPTCATPLRETWQLAPGVRLVELLADTPPAPTRRLFSFTWVVRGRMLEWVKPKPGAEDQPSDGICMQASGKVTALGFFRREGDKDFSILAEPSRYELHRGPCLMLRIDGPRVGWRVGA